MFWPHPPRSTALVCLTQILLQRIPPVKRPYSTDRRSFLKWSLGGVLGMSLPECLALQKTQAAGTITPGHPAKNVLVILEQGGLSHIDTWDPKPEVIAEQRSPYRPVATTVPGMRFTELLSHFPPGWLTSSPWFVRCGTRAVGRTIIPTAPTMCCRDRTRPCRCPCPISAPWRPRQLGTACRCLPPYIMVPGNDEQNAVASNGFLPIATRPFKTGGYDLSHPNWRVGELSARQENQGARLAERRGLLQQVDSAPSCPVSAFPSGAWIASTNRPSIP